MAVILQRNIHVEVIGEIPSGVKNGVNAVFSTTTPYQNNTTKIYFNGRRLVIGVTADYTEAPPNNITLNRIPESNDYVVIDYHKA